MNRCPCCGDLIKAIDRYIAKADSDLEGQLEEAGFLNAKESVQEASDLEDELAEILNGQTEDIVEELGSAKDLRDAKKKIKRFFANDTETTKMLTEVFEEYFETAIPSLATEYISEIEPDLSVTTLRARTADWISSWSEELSNLMNLSSENRMDELLQDALDNGDSVADFARKLMEEGIRNEGWTARRAALTEMLRAHNVANNEAIMQSPATDRKRWRHSGAYKIKPRPNHVEMDGQTVPKADPFTLIGADGVTYYPMFPIDSILPPGEAINCHCISQPIVDDDVLGMSLEEREKLQQEIIDNDDGEWEKELDAKNRAKAGIETVQNMSDAAQVDWPEQGESISKEEYEEIREHAKSHGIRISGFRKYDGEIDLIKECITNMDTIAADFPKVKEGRKKLTLELNRFMNSCDYARTDNHIVGINADAFRDRKILEETYAKDVEKRLFVPGTDYHSIVRHEMGHVVSNIYGIDASEIAMEITGKNLKETLKMVQGYLSEYSGKVSDGSEIIAEVFSDYYSNEKPCDFSLQFMEKCFNIISEA